MKRLNSSFPKIPTQLSSSLKLKLFLKLAKKNKIENKAELPDVEDADAIAADADSKAKAQLVQILAAALARVDAADSEDWQVFRGVDGIYAIQPNGKYYRLNISANGELKLYRGKDRIYLGERLDQGYVQASRV